MRNDASILLLSLTLIGLALIWVAIPSSKIVEGVSAETLAAPRNTQASSHLPSASHRQFRGLRPSLRTQSDPRPLATSPLAPTRPQPMGAEAAVAVATEARPLRNALDRAARRAQTERDLTVESAVLATAIEEGAVRVLLTGDLTTAKILRDRHPSGAEQSGFRTFPLLGSAAGRISADALLQLINSGSSLHIEMDAVHRPSLADSLHLIGADQLHASEFDGDGFAIAILDTGIDLTHPFFSDRIIEEACFSAEATCPNGERTMLGAGAAAPCTLAGCGHGTHVAGILAADEVDGSLRGAAPHAALIAIQIFSDVDGSPGAYSSDILAGLQHVLALADFHAIAAVNLSFGSGEFESACDASTALYKAVRRLRELGIASVAAAGNDASSNAIASPACLSNVISVSSVNDDDTISSFSNTSASLSLLGPGRSILSSAVGGGTAWNSGTSMATPHVAGTITALREAYPEASVADLENALHLSGIPIVDYRSGLTFPRIQADAARTLLAAVAAAPPEETPPVPDFSEADAETLSAARPKSGGGGGGCGLVGLEPFIILGLIRIPSALKQRRRA